MQLTDLAPETTYHYRVSASAAGETATGVDRTFTTDAAPAPAPPVISGVQADPGHDAATITFSTDIAASGEVEFGTDTNYGLGTETSPAGTSHTVQLTDLAPETTYHYRVSASAAGETATGVDRTFTTDAAPVAGAPVIDIPEGDLLPIGQNGISQDAANIIGTITDPDGIQSSTFQVGDAAPRPLALGKNQRRLAAPGYFNAEILLDELVPGENAVTIRAVDQQGAASERVVTIDYTTGVSLPLPTTVDWSSASSITDVANIVDGFWTKTPDGIRTTQIAYDRLIALGDVAWTDYEVTLPVTVHAVDHENGDPWPSNGPAVGLGLRWAGHSQVAQEWPRDGFYPVGAFGYQEWPPTGTDKRAILAEGTWTRRSEGTMDLNRPYVFKMRVESGEDGNGSYALKVWPQDEAEPAAWSVTSPAPNDLDAGAVLLLAHHVDATFGNVQVSPINE